MPSSSSRFTFTQSAASNPPAAPADAQATPGSEESPRPLPEAAASLQAEVAGLFVTAQRHAEPKVHTRPSARSGPLQARSAHD